MKKILMTWAICLAFAGMANAETEYYWFDYGNADGWTTIDADGDGFCWLNSKDLDGNNSGYQGGYCMMSKSFDFNAGYLTPDDYLVSPLLHFHNAPAICFYISMNEIVDGNDHFGVAVSTTGNTNPADFTMIYEADVEPGRAHGQWWLQKVDLSAYSGQEVYVAIRHFGASGRPNFCLDNITVASRLFDYEPLVKGTDIMQQWNVKRTYSNFIWGEYWTDIFTLEDEVEIDGLTYREVQYDHLGNGNVLTYGYMREEDRKVYYRQGQESPEFVLYDFGLQIGDSLAIYDDGEYAEYLKVTAIREDYLIFEQRTTYMLNPDFGQSPDYCYDYGNDVWHEGIGSERGVVFRFDGSLGSDEMLLCYHEDYYLIYGGGNCNQSNLSVEENEDEIEDLVFPNPTTGVLNIAMKDFRNVELFNSMGQRVLQSHETALDLNNLPAGVYFLKLTDNQGAVTMRSVVKK